MGDTSVGLFNFRGDQYPTNGEVFRYMSSRRGKNNQPLIIREMASKIRGIWCLGDGFPFSEKTIIDRYHKLIKERKVYLAPLYALTHPRKQSDPELLDFTKKHRLPSTGREKSRRQTQSVYRAPNPKDELNEQPPEISTGEMEPSGRHSNVNPPKRARTSERHVETPEQRWMREIGSQLMGPESERL